MPTPIALCLERLGEDCFIRCLAMPGGEPGLAVDTAGAVLWHQEDNVAFELWVSLDQRLILRRPTEAAAVTLSRAGRVTSVPVGKPVVIVDQDEVHIGGATLRIHLHVAADGVQPATRSSRGLLRTAAAALAAGATLAGVSTSAGQVVPSPSASSSAPDVSDAGVPPVEIREAPPAPPPPPPPPGGCCARKPGTDVAGYGPSEVGGKR